MNLLFDLKYAWRLLVKSWGYSLVCATVVALSVGLAVWVYAVAYSLLWKPLGFPGAERWFSVQLSADAGTPVRPAVDAYTYQELVKRTRGPHYLGAFANRVVVLSEGQASTSLRSGVISPSLFSALHVQPAMGRVFVDTDGQSGAAPVAVISYDTWQSYFAGDRGIIGKTARIDAAPVQVVGVMPKDFFAFQDFQLWQPLQLPALARPADSTMILAPLVTLEKGQNLGVELAEMKSAVAEINGDDPRQFNAGRKVALISAQRMFTHSNAPLVAMLGLMAGAVLLLGGVNISMIFLARLLERSRELALRTALGSSRGRLIRQCLMETSLIVLIGLIAGYGLAAYGIRWCQNVGDFLSQVMASGRLAFTPELRPMDLVAAVASALVVWLLSTLIPAWRISRQDAAVVLAGSGKGAAVGGRNKGVGVVVGLQVAVSCLVLVVCSNVVLAVNKEVRRPSGMSTARVMISTAPTEFDARYADDFKRLRYWEDLTAAVERHLPGAQVALTTAPPSKPDQFPAAIEARQGAQNDGALLLPFASVSERYFEVLGLTARSGRLFDTTDNAGSVPVAVVDQQLVARYWPDGDAVGKRIQLNPAANGPWLTIVGVVSGVTGRPYHRDDVGVVYRPLRQAVPSQFELLVKLPTAAAANGRAALRAAAFEVDRDLPLHNLQTLDDYLAALNLTYQAIIPVLSVVALITALLAASGLFGLISRSVAQRTQEIGIRRALGATPVRATSMFLRQGAIYLAVALVAVVLAIGVMPPLSAKITNVLEHVLPVTLGIALLMALVIAAASYFPSRRAVALEPGDALRYE